jgi:hypothetical protein
MDGSHLITLARFARDSYPEPYESEADWRERLGDYLQDNDLKFYQNSGTDAFTFRGRDALFVIVRGTHGTFDVLTDLASLREPSPIGGKIHKGFNASARRLWLSIMETVLDALDDGFGIYLGGHSLGAGVVTALAARMWSRGIPVDGVLAMASPRVGDWKFSRQLRPIHILRTQNNRDPVSHLPAFWFGYAHAGIWAYFDRNKECHIKPSLAFVLHDKIRSAISDGFGLWGSIGDHSSALHCHLIEKNIPKLSSALAEGTPHA